MLQRDGHFVFVDGEAIGGSLDEAEASALFNRLDQQAGQSLGAGDDKFVADDEQNMLIKIAGDNNKAEIAHVIAGDWKYMPPDTVKTFLHGVLSTGAALWKQAV
jgi:hypothetical protein